MTKGIFVRNMDKLKVVINRTDTCYISKNQNCFVSWKIFKNAYSNFDGGVFSQKEPYCKQYLNSSTSEPYCNQYLNSSTSEKFLHFRQEKRVKLLCFFFNFVILDYPYKNMLLPITSHQQRSRRFLFFLYAKDLALVAGSMVSANHWLKGMETYTFLW